MAFSTKYFYFYSFLWGLYYLQGTLYESGGILSQGLLAIILMYSFCLVFIANTKPPKELWSKFYFSTLNILLILLTVYGFAGLFVGVAYGFSPFRLLKPYYCSILPIYCYYLYAKNNSIKQVDIIIFLLFMVGVSIAFYFKNYKEISFSKGIEDITNNVGYMFIPFIALLPLLKTNRIFKYCVIAIVGYFALMAAKRGAVLCFVLCLFEYLYFEVRQSSITNKIVVLLTSSVLLVVGYQLAVETIMSDAYLSYRLDQTLNGDSSSRDIVFSRLYHSILYEQSFFKIFFGHGIYGTLEIAGKLAHNDWLEFYIDMGLLGFIAYSSYWVAFVHLLKKQVFKESFAALFIIASFCFVRTLFSQSLSDMYVITSFIIGYCLVGKECKKKRGETRRH